VSLDECPASTGIPVAGKRCTVHTARGAHECKRIPTHHYEHECRCGVRWWSTSPIGRWGEWDHVGDGRTIPRLSDDALPDANERAIQRGLGSIT
jgi:hypothetical protein